MRTVHMEQLAGVHQAGLLALLDRCSAQTLYQRFLTYAPAAGHRHVESLFTDPLSHTVVAVSDTGPVGFGSLFLDGDTAEVALLVADDEQGRGTGTQLAGHLCRYAVEAGVRRLELTALAHNHHIVRLFRRWAGAVTFGRPDAGTVTATIGLEPRSAYRLAA